MKISLVTNNEDFVSFLENRAAGMQILNRYRTLTDKAELKKFNNDFNHVDVFMFIDFQDLSKEFKEFFQRGNSYFLNTKEILLITYKDANQSPTPDLEKNLEAIEAFLEKDNLNLRVVRLETLIFQDIYKSITITDSLIDNAPKKLIKYKVMHNSDGIAVSPKKADITIVPDTLKGKGSEHKKEDLQSSNSMDGTIIHVPSIVEPLRMEKNFSDYASISLADTTVVFITGVRYSGKTTLALKCAKELEEQNLGSVVVDLTARKDIKLINREIKCNLGVLKGLDPDSVTTNKVIGVNIFSKVSTSTFLTNLLKNVTNGRPITFCEVDLEQLETMYKSFRGNKAALLVTPNNQVMLRDTVTYANKLDFQVVPVINKSFVTEQEIKAEHLKDGIRTAKSVHSVKNIQELVASLLR